MKQVLDWSESWAPLITLIIFFLKKTEFSKFIIAYILIALVLNLLVDIPWKFYYSNNVMPKIYKYNNLFYNIHSIVRLFVFFLFFYRLKIPLITKFFYIFLVGVSMLIIINFLFESINKFSSNIFTLEGVVLIILCILFFLKRLRSDELSTEFDSSLYIVTGLAIYEAVCFPIFLFYNTLMRKTEDYAVSIWDVHNIAYIVFCLFIARAFYGSNLRRTAN